MKDNNDPIIEIDFGPPRSLRRLPWAIAGGLLAFILIAWLLPLVLR